MVVFDPWIVLILGVLLNSISKLVTLAKKLGFTPKLWINLKNDFNGLIDLCYDIIDDLLHFYGEFFKNP